MLLGGDGYFIWWNVVNGQAWRMCAWADVWILDCCLSFASFVESILPFLYVCSGDWTKFARVRRQVPLSTEPGHWHLRRKCLCILGISGSWVSAYNPGLTCTAVPGLYAAAGDSHSGPRAGTGSPAPVCGFLSASLCVASGGCSRCGALRTQRF